MRYQHINTKQTFMEKGNRMWHNEALHNKYVAGLVLRSEFIHKNVQQAGIADV
jgi:hypothetical protein